MKKTRPTLVQKLTAPPQRGDEVVTSRLYTTNRRPDWLDPGTKGLGQQEGASIAHASKRAARLSRLSLPPSPQNNHQGEGKETTTWATGRALYVTRVNEGLLGAQEASKPTSFSIIKQDSIMRCYHMTIVRGRKKEWFIQPTRLRRS